MDSNIISTVDFGAISGASIGKLSGRRCSRNCSTNSTSSSSVSSSSSAAGENGLSQSSDAVFGEFLNWRRVPAAVSQKDTTNNGPAMVDGTQQPKTKKPCVAAPARKRPNPELISVTSPHSITPLPPFLADTQSSTSTQSTIHTATNVEVIFLNAYEQFLQKASSIEKEHDDAEHALNEAEMEHSQNIQRTKENARRREGLDRHNEELRRQIAENERQKAELIREAQSQHETTQRSLQIYEKMHAQFHSVEKVRTELHGIVTTWRPHSIN